jgi:hypothetical protein
VTLLPWEERPVEFAHLLNPAFCALLIRDTAGGYQATASQTLPYALAYLVLPIVLYPPVREALPGNTSKLLPSWLQENPALQFHVTTRVSRMVAYSREAILFGLQHDLMRIDDDGGIEPGTTPVRNLFATNTEPAECRKSAALIGRWFGKMDNPSLVLTLWGLRP